MGRFVWVEHRVEIEGVRFTCGHCGSIVGPNTAFVSGPQYSGGDPGYICICTVCSKPTFLAPDTQVPPMQFGNHVSDITDQAILTLYDEARGCASVGAYTAAVMACRKILMNIAVQKGAATGLSFAIEF
jgi:hypothetical protein